MVLESVVQYTVLELLLLVVYFENLSKNESVDDDGWQYEGCSSLRKAIQILLYSKSYTFVWCTICAAVTTVMASLVAIGRHRRRPLQASPFYQQPNMKHSDGRQEQFFGCGGGKTLVKYYRTINTVIMPSK